MTQRRCRTCGGALSVSFADLGMSPLANTLRSAEDDGKPETFYPLHAWVCDDCRLVQLDLDVSPETLFADYPYFSSYSDTWNEHARRYATHMTEALGLGAGSLVIEAASNDGYLLKHFWASGIPVLGIEPATTVAQAAITQGIPTKTVFLTRENAGKLVSEGYRADLVVANNVLAHVPDPNDFVAGLAALLKPTGVLTIEFPHLLNLIEGGQFDTIYHEHFSYLSFVAAERLLRRHALEVFDVEELPTHGGSLRLLVGRADAGRKAEARVEAMRRREEHAGLLGPEIYRDFGNRMAAVKCDLLRFLIDARAEGKSVVGYGAPAKGSTLLNYCGVGPELLPFTVDRNPAKQGRRIPGTGIAIEAPERLFAARPDYVLILPWNLTDEITGQLAAIRGWGGGFAVAIPSLRVF